MAKQPALPKTEQDDATPAFEPQKTDDGRTIYEIEAKAPAYVAGRKVSGKKEIALFEEEARAELLAGHIWPKGMPRKARPVKPAKPSDEDAGGQGEGSEGDGGSGSNDV